MTWPTTVRKPAPGLLSLSVSPLRSRGAAAVLIWFEALQWAFLNQTCTRSEQWSLHIFAFAAETAAHTELNAQFTTDNIKNDLERFISFETVPVLQQQPSASTHLILASGHAEERKLTSALLKSGAPGAALVVALVSGITTYLYGSPKQAYKRLSLKARRKVPWSWSRYMRSLPVLKEADFTDFPKKWPEVGNRPLVMLVKDVSPKLAKFLHLGREEKLHGIAIKTTTAGKRRNAKDVLNEINAHINMVPRSKFILPVLGAYRAENGERVYLILPRLRGNAQIMLEKQADTVNVQPALAEMAYSVKLLHDAGFLHRDIKLLNFFVGFDGHMVLADFEGTFDKSMWVDSDRDLVVYSEGYLAPEVRRDKQWVRFNEKSDIYALGVCFKLFLKHATRVPHKAHLQRLVEKMTAKDVSERYNMKQVLKSPFFNGINFNEIELLNQGVPFPSGDEPYEDTRRFL